MAKRMTPLRTRDDGRTHRYLRADVVTDADVEVVLKVDGKIVDSITQRHVARGGKGLVEVRLRSFPDSKIDAKVEEAVE